MSVHAQGAPPFGQGRRGSSRSLVVAYPPRLTAGWSNAPWLRLLCPGWTPFCRSPAARDPPGPPRRWTMARGGTGTHVPVNGVWGRANDGVYGGGGEFRAPSC